jgi:hypothetical protein
MNSPFTKGFPSSDKSGSAPLGTAPANFETFWGTQRVLLFAEFTKTSADLSAPSGALRNDFRLSGRVVAR